MVMKKIGKLSYDYPLGIIGEGSTGTTVYRGIHHASGGNERVAVKRIQMRPSHAAADESTILELITNAGYHPNILLHICTERNDDFW